MHAALQTPDILNEIFEHLSEPLQRVSPSHEGPWCLHNAPAPTALHETALVCKAFSEPALKHLWSHIPRIDVILGLFPTSAKLVPPSAIPRRNGPASAGEQQYKSNVLVWVMEGPITDAERARFTWYAQHIRIFHLCTAWHVELDATVFEHLARAGLGLPLFPRLHTLFNCGIALRWLPHQSAAVALLSGPALRTLSLAFPDTGKAGAPAGAKDDLIGPLLTGLATSAPGLENLKIHCASCTTFPTSLGGLRSLRTLDLDLPYVHLNKDFLRTLVPLDRLEELSLWDMFTGTSEDVTPIRGFKNLRRLFVYGGMWTIDSLLASLPELRLKELTLLKEVDCPSIEHVKRLGDALCAGPGKHLEKLTLLSFSGGEQLAEKSVSELLFPFFALRTLRSITFESWEPVKIVNEDLQKFGRAWPKLEVLHVLRAHPELLETVAPTITGLVELANVCPGLRDVDIPAIVPVLALGAVVPPLYLATQSISKVPLPLWIPDEQIRDVRQLARVLHSVFKGKRLLVTGLDEMQYKRWSAVLDRMAELSQE